MLSGDEASYLTCGRGIHNSITHRKSARKSSIQAKWMAPSNFEGEVIFRYTFLQEYKTFWVGQESDRIRVSRSSSDEQDILGTQESNPSDQDLTPSAKTSEDTIKVVQSPADNNLDNNENKIDKSKIVLDDSEIVLDDIPQPAQNAIIPKDSAEKTEQVRLFDCLTCLLYEVEVKNSIITTCCCLVYDSNHCVVGISFEFICFPD